MRPNGLIFRSLRFVARSTVEVLLSGLGEAEMGRLSKRKIARHLERECSYVPVRQGADSSQQEGSVTWRGH